MNRKSVVDKRAGILFLLLLLISCNAGGPIGPSDPEEYKNAVITLQRGPCYGPCPVYKLTIHGSGLVEYEGYDFVGTYGYQATHISQEAVKSLVDEFYRIDYFKLNDAYTEGPTDGQFVWTSISIDGQYKEIVNYSWDNEDVGKLEQKIDLVVNTAQWTNGWDGTYPE
ncbi:MAG TPA: DUF6438 domain-containing protein [bacterium]|jgi:hypothetical protein